MSIVVGTVAHGEVYRVVPERRQTELQGGAGEPRRQEVCGVQDRVDAPTEAQRGGGARAGGLVRVEGHLEKMVGNISGLQRGGA